MVELRPHVARERGLALKQMTDMQPCSKVLMQGRLFSHGETWLFCSLELHRLNCKRTHANSFKGTRHRLNILYVMPSSGCCMLRPHPVKCRTSQCTTVQHDTSQLVVFTSATDHTWPHPTGLLGVVSGATDLNLSTHRGQCNNFDSILDLVWSCSLTVSEASSQHKTVRVVNNSPTCWYIQRHHSDHLNVTCNWFPDHAGTCLGLGIKSLSLVVLVLLLRLSRNI